MKLSRVRKALVFSLSVRGEEQTRRCEGLGKLCPIKWVSVRPSTPLAASYLWNSPDRRRCTLRRRPGEGGGAAW